MSGKRPNIVFITTDQHRYDSVGFNGNPHVRTPNLDALAGEGCVLDHCFVQTSVCAPSRASLMTGRYPHLHGQLSNGFTLRAGERLWWQDLAAAGYRTAGIGKMHVEPWDDPLGFEDNIRIEGKDWLTGEDEYVKFLREQGYTFNRPRQAPEVRGLHWTKPRLSPVPTEHYIDTYIADRAVGYLDAVAGDERPVAAWISFCSPHHPVDPPQEYAERYAETPAPAHVFDPDEPQRKPPEQQVMYYWHELDEATRVRAWQYYYATIELVDDQVGRVVEALKRTGRYEDTVIVFVADHGEMLFQHGLFDKAFAFYDDVYRVPAFVRWPGELTPGRFGSLVELIDLVTVFYQAAGLELPARLSGQDLAATVRGTLAPRKNVVGEHFHMRMLRTAEAKLVTYADREYGECYDLTRDPHELNNLWDSPAHAGLREDLLKQLVSRMTHAIDPTFKELPAPSNKGAYGDYLKQWDDLRIRYLSG